MKLIVDRFEGQYMVCETEKGEMVNIPKEEVSVSVSEGDVFEIDDNKVSKILLEETLKRKQKIEEMVKNLWEN